MSFLLRFFARWIAIISLLGVAFAVGGCSAVRLGYNNAPTVAYWWLDRYFDFDTAQGVRVRADLQALHAWHRQEEMPLAADLLKKLRVATPQSTTPEQLCSVFTDIKGRGEVALDRMVPTLAALVPTLQDAQLEHMAQAFEKRNQTWREEWLDGTPAQRTERRVKMTVSRAESFYGTLTAAQVALLQAQMGSFDVDADLIYRERVLRQKDALQTMRDLRDNANATPAQRETQIHALLARAVQPSDPAVRQSRARRSNQGCAAMAALHNSSSPAQRQTLAENLQNYENDVLVLISQR